MLRVISIAAVLVTSLVLASSAPSEAATPLNCKNAATIIGFTSTGRGIRVDLVKRVTDASEVEALLRQYGLERVMGEAAQIQLHYAVPSRYLLMAASSRGCYLAHVFLEEDEARAFVADHP